MSDLFLDIHIALPPDEYIREVLPGIISDLGFDGFAEDDKGIHCYIKKELWMSTMDTAIKDLTSQLNLPMFEILSITEIKNQNWNAEWEKSIRPITITDSIIVTPSWHPIKENGKMVLTIDPKMTFGTGYHESTRLMLRAMEKNIRPDCSVLDVGTGTGILSIAAAKLGAKKVIGIDIDEWSMDNGIENVRQNHVEDNVEIRIGSLESVEETNFDFIVANIVKNTILELLDGIVGKLAEHGVMIFSGLLQKDTDDIKSALGKRGFNVSSILQENEWVALVTESR